ncbi:hypothetical protein VNO77_31928 [Canavalia gladiata]|uniref:Uncharacterized protein n=1 Tax=Canavalia gladiata TaxID=3824 RepID=A0AAN9KQ35_CANGL
MQALEEGFSGEVFFKISNDISQFLGPLISNQLLLSMQSDYLAWKGCVYALLILSREKGPFMQNRYLAHHKRNISYEHKGIHNISSLTARDTKVKAPKLSQIPCKLIEKGFDQPSKLSTETCKSPVATVKPNLKTLIVGPIELVKIRRKKLA